MEIIKYPDGTSYIEVESNTLDLADSAHKKIFRINSYEDLWHLNQYVDVCNNVGVRPSITIPNLIDAQADRRFYKNQSSGLKLVCKFLNNMKADFNIFHPHNPEVVEALMDNVEIIDNSEFIKKVLYNEIARGPGFPDTDVLNNLILMSSDAGGFKPLMKLCDKIDWRGQTASASKSRLWNGKESKLIQQIQCNDFEGKDILIIDDISIYGGTSKGLSKLLRERNCGKLYLAVSHMTIQDLGTDPVTNYFDKVFTTNSKFDFYGYPSGDNTGLNKPKNLEIIKMF